jgi:hypothetical protein
MFLCLSSCLLFKYEFVPVLYLNCTAYKTMKTLNYDQKVCSVYDLRICPFLGQEANPIKIFKHQGVSKIMISHPREKLSHEYVNVIKF